MKRQIKAVVFTDFFGQPKNAILLYRFLHPEDVLATEKDVEIITLENVLTDNLQNDLGILVGDRLMILVEHQEKWDPNVVFRTFFYLAHSYNEYFKIHNIISTFIAAKRSRRLSRNSTCCLQARRKTFRNK